MALNSFIEKKCSGSTPDKNNTTKITLKCVCMCKYIYKYTIEQSLLPLQKHHITSLQNSKVQNNEVTCMLIGLKFNTHTQAPPFMALLTTVTDLEHKATEKSKPKSARLTQESPMLLLAWPPVCTRVGKSHHSSALHLFTSTFGFKLVSLWHMDYPPYSSPLLCLRALHQ